MAKAKTRKLSVSLFRRISDGDYGTFGAEVTEEVELGDDDDRTKTMSRIKSRLEEDLNEALQAAFVKVKKAAKG